MKMKAAVFHGYHDIEVAEVPIPEPEEGEVLIKVELTGAKPD